MCVASLTVVGALVVPAVSAAAGPGQGDSKSGAHKTMLLRGQASGAQTAEGLTIFHINGTAFSGRINAFVAPTARLTLVSPEGITAPVSPNGECTQDSPTRVSCVPGFVDVIAGNLRGGADTFTAARGLLTLIGAKLVGPDAALAGGGGRDRLIGGGASDLIVGGNGPDSMWGNGSSDLLLGGSGKDKLRGGPSADALYGGGGSDDLDGGRGRDLCAGGGGRDAATNCTSLKKIP